MTDEISGGPSFDGMPYAAIRRFARGESDPAERRRIEAWAATSTSRQEYLSALARTFARYHNSATSNERPATDAAWTAIRARLDVSAADETVPSFIAPWEIPATRVDVRRHPVRILTGAFASRRRHGARFAAAAALLIAGAGVFVLRERAHTPVGASAQVTMREVTTAVGQRARIELGDGSTVTLGVKSRLRFASNFGVHSRNLYLDGEAYFEVKHDSVHPLTVHAAGSKTVDIGTAFALRAYPGDPRVQVVVKEGRVGLGADHPGAPAPTVLEPGQMGRLAHGSTVATVHSVDPSLYTQWMNDRLVFDNAPLSQVITDVARWHDVKIVLADSSLAHETFTATFAADSFSETLNTITTVLNLRAERRGTVVILRRRRRG